MTLTDKQQQELRRFEAAQRKMHKGTYTIKGGGQALENDYASSYRNLMAAGLMPKLRGKYKYPG